MTPKDLSDPQHVAAVLGYDDLDEDSVMTPLGLRTLSRVSVVRDGVAEKIVDEYGSLQELMDDISEDPERLGDFGVNNPAILADSLYRMKAPNRGTHNAPVCAVVVAGGSGQRFGNPGGKQLVNVAGRPLMSWSIRAFDRSDKVGHIVVVCPAERRAEMCRLAIDPFDYDTPISFADAGDTRQDSTVPACMRFRRVSNMSPFTTAPVRSLRPRRSITLSTCS